MFTLETTVIVMIEFYLLGILGHLILLLMVMNATKPADASKRTGQWLTGIAILSSVLWPGLAVLLGLMVTPLGPWLGRWVERKYGTAGGTDAAGATS